MVFGHFNGLDVKEHGCDMKIKFKDMLREAGDKQSKEMALKMLKKNSPVEKVVFCTRLPFEEVERLKRSLTANG